MSTTEEEQGSPEIQKGDFTTQNCGTYPGFATGNMPLDSQMAINGCTDLSECVVGPHHAYVQSVHFKSRGGVRQAEIIVYGAGPAGTGSGRLNLIFTSESGQEHTLSLFSSSPGKHTDRFRDTSAITSLNWTHT